MNFQTVKLKLSSNALITGSIFELNKNITYPDKEARKYKAEYEEFVDLCTQSISTITSLMTVGVKLDKLAGYASGGRDVSVAELTLDLSIGVEKTFKFLGMDITDNLDAVIKGSMGMVYVGNLCNPNAMKVGMNLGMPTRDQLTPKELSRVGGSLTPDNIRKSVEDLKFLTLAQVKGLNYGNQNVTSIKEFPFLYNIVDSVDQSSSTLTFQSVILNYVESGVSTDSSDEVLDPDIMKRGVYVGVCTYWEALITSYMEMSKLISALDMFFRLSKKICGKDITEKIMRESLQGDDSMLLYIGTLEGYCQDENIESRTLQCTLGAGLVGFFKSLSKHQGNTMTHPKSAYMSTMFEVPNDMDMSKVHDVDTCLSYSVLDALKFKDDDLVLVTDQYDMNNVDEREVFLKNVISGYKKKFSGYLHDKGIDIDNTIIQRILPDNWDSVVDILNVGKKDNVLSSNTDVEISRVSFVKTSLETCSKLTEKILKTILKSFIAKVK